MSFDHKDLRLRMADLEKKLAESEEERFKLEKTCKVLIRAFKEEEKMRYNNLNRKYEKFLQDYSLRKKRNDIIMRSLCRIEDRCRMLSAKTERLKLLKDQYISYLKISDVKPGEVSLKSFPFSSPSQKTTDDVTSKFVQWKSPLAEVERDFISSESPGLIKSVRTDSGHNESDKLSAEVTINDRSHQEYIENLKKPLSAEEFSDIENVADTYEENGQKEISVVMNHLSTFDPESESKQDNREEIETKSESEVPMGLDGVDYQNETYPESYYEQPVHHHDHTNIAADVILEEDETELEEESPRLPPVDVMKSSSESKSDRGEEIICEKTKPKSSLVQMLESDSESFQIEHGGAVSGNDDSDFDFSFQ